MQPWDQHSVWCEIDKPHVMVYPGSAEQRDRIGGPCVMIGSYCGASACVGRSFWNETDTGETSLWTPEGAIRMLQELDAAGCAMVWVEDDSRLIP